LFYNLSDKQRSEALLRFYVTEIHNRLRTEISDDDLESSLVDNPKDLGADLVYRDDGQVLVIQTKFRGTDKAESAEDISYFQAVLSRLADPNFKPNTKLAEIRGTIDFQNDIFRLVFVTFGRIIGQAADQVKASPKLPDDIPDIIERCEWEFLSEKELDDEYRNAHSITAGIPDDQVELFSAGKKGERTPLITLTNGPHRSCVLVLEAPQLVALYQNYRDRLFNLNIRNFIGSTKQNKKIVSTAEERPATFYYFNNGVSCLAREMSIDPKASKVTVRGIQIINGAQTVKALVRAFNSGTSVKPTWPDDKPLVLVRITEIGKGYGEEGRFLEEVTRFNNTQNVIKDSDFRSNDIIQLDLKEKFGSYNRFAKSVSYTPKRTDRPSTGNEIIRLEEFCKVIYAFFVDPISFSSSTSFLFDDSSSGGYVHVFGDGLQIWEHMPTEEFRVRSAVWWLAQEFSIQIKLDREAATDPVRKAALERKWHLLFATRLILERHFGTAYKDMLAKLYRGDWHLSDGKLGNWFRLLYDTSEQTIQYLYAQAVKRQDFVHRNWMRSDKSMTAIRDYISDAPLPQLPPAPIQ